MKTNLVKTLVKIITASAFLHLSAGADTVSVFDTSFTITNPQSSSTLGARWGTWNGSQFTELSAGNLGYATIAPVGDTELSVTLNQLDNTNYSAGSSLALAIYTNGINDASAVSYTSATFRSVLVDTSWVTPTFADNGVDTRLSFNTTTSAVVGTYAFNGGTQIIELSAIPEPSTFAALFGAAALGMAAFHRRRPAV